VEVDRNDVRHRSDASLALGEHAAIEGAVTHGNDPFRIGCRGIGAFQRLAHVLRDWPRYQKHIGMAG